MVTYFEARYHEHHTEIAKEFFKWYKNGTHADVTIHAGGQLIPAHKVVLAANSPFFNGVFLDTKRENSHLYFTEVPFQSMKSLIEYMYSGDLIVEHEFLPACLKLGDSLRVKGISGTSMDDIITEPVPVSIKMHQLINSLMKQQEQQQLEQQQHQQQQQQQQEQEQEQLQQQQQVEFQIPNQQMTSRQKKRFRRKCRKMLGQNGQLDDKGSHEEIPKEILQWNKDNDGYKLKQICNPINVIKNIVTMDNNSHVELHQQGDQNTNDACSVNGVKKVNGEIDSCEMFVIKENLNLKMQLKRKYNNENAIVSKIESSEDRDRGKEKLPFEKCCNDAINRNEMFVDVTQEVEPSNVPSECCTSPSIDQKLQEKVDANYCVSNCFQRSKSSLKNEVLKGKVDIVGEDESSSPNKENVKQFGQDYNIEPSILSNSKSHTVDGILNEEQTGVKQKRRNRVSRFSARNLDVEFEKLFGDNYFGISNKVNNNVQFSFDPYQQRTSEPIINTLGETNNEQAQEMESKKKGVIRQRRIPMCPPPEDIFRNGRQSFCCVLCKRVYTHKSNYRRHYMVFHKRREEAIFQCPMCEKKFTRSDNRTHHIRRIHGYTSTASVLSEEQAFYLCPICKKAFTRSYNRTFHLEIEHGVRNPALLEK